MDARLPVNNCREETQWMKPNLSESHDLWRGVMLLWKTSSCFNHSPLCLLLTCMSVMSYYSLWPPLGAEVSFGIKHDLTSLDFVIYLLVFRVNEIIMWCIKYNLYGTTPLDTVTQSLKHTYMLIIGNEWYEKLNKISVWPLRGSAGKSQITDEGVCLESAWCFSSQTYLLGYRTPIWFKSALEKAPSV